jgi:hypothetical protein
VEVTLPEYPQKYTDVSFHLVKTETKSTTFQSCKSQIQRDVKLKEKEGKILKNLEKKREEMEKIKKENSGLQPDEDTFLGISYSVSLGTKSSQSASRWEELNVSRLLIVQGA